MSWRARIILGQFAILLAVVDGVIAFGLTNVSYPALVFNVIVGVMMLGHGIHQIVIAGVEAAAEIAERKRTQALQHAEEPCLP